VADRPMSWDGKQRLLECELVFYSSFPFDLFYFTTIVIVIVVFFSFFHVSICIGFI
jgi:hypothetical protein